MAEFTWSGQQTAIFDWFDHGKGHLIARARAGTGKTTVILEGVKRAPERAILVCAFSKTIQLELQARIGKDHPHITAKTLHAIGLACISRYRERMRVDYSSARADQLSEAVCGAAAPDAIKRLVSKLHTKGRLMAPHATRVGDLTDIAYAFECEPDEEWATCRVCGRDREEHEADDDHAYIGFDITYVEEKALAAMEMAAGVKSGESIDGSDMIFLPVRNGWLTKLYDLVVVDEAQDMTTAQLEIAQGVLKRGGRIAIVGDDRQAIFGFIGADCHSLDRLKAELKATELGLTTTYRCGKSIVAMAQEIVPDFQAGPGNPEGTVTDLMMDKLVAEAGPGDFILSRVNAPLVGTAIQLLRAGKRARVAGRDIGAGLRGIMRKMKARSVPDLLRRIESWSMREQQRHEAQMARVPESRRAGIISKIELVADQAEMLTSLASGAKSVAEMETRIEALFADDGLGAAGMITCSSVHRAKGLEANRVFVLADTLRNNSQEEQNITYVAITRAKQTLVMVHEKRSA